MFHDIDFLFSYSFTLLFILRSILFFLSLVFTLLLFLWLLPFVLHPPNLFLLRINDITNFLDNEKMLVSRCPGSGTYCISTNVHYFIEAYRPKPEKYQEICSINTDVKTMFYIDNYLI